MAKVDDARAAGSRRSLSLSGALMSQDSHDAIKAVFDAFVVAVQKVDPEAFEALTVADEAPETELFLFNAEKMREQSLSLRIREIAQEGGVAEVTFKILDESGADIDEGMITLTLEDEGWRIRAL